MKLAIGEEMEFNGEKFVVTDINVDHSLNGRMLALKAYDPDSANRFQQEAIRRDRAGDVQTSVLNAVKELIEKHGGQIPPNFGIGM